MQKRRFGGQLVKVRAHAIAHACSLFFIMLILVPFTAPFPTFDLHDVSSSHQSGALPKDIKEKTNPDEALTGAAHAFAPPSVNVVVVTVASRSNQLNEHLSPHSILRL